MLRAFKNLRFSNMRISLSIDDPEDEQINEAIPSETDSILNVREFISHDSKHTHLSSKSNRQLINLDTSTLSL